MLGLQQIEFRELAESSSTRPEFFVCTTFHDATGLQDENAVGIADGAQPVRNHDASSAKSLQPSSHRGLGPVV